MKKGALLNSEISHVVSRLGHTDSLVICDAGLPVPAGPLASRVAAGTS